jgi:hypothetical protein
MIADKGLGQLLAPDREQRLHHLDATSRGDEFLQK